MVTLLRVLALAVVCLSASAQPDVVRSLNINSLAKWDQPSFYWTTNVPEFATDIEWALSQWSIGTPLTFTKGPGPQWLRIDLTWVNACGIPNDGYAGHAHYPPSVGGMWAGTVHLNGTHYDLFKQNRNILRRILLHEVGHALGLPHFGPSVWSIMSYAWMDENSDREPMLGFYDRLFIAEMYSPRRGSCSIGTTMWTCF